jgi:ribosomal protein S18 acetylase RimI-like enzyme
MFDPAALPTEITRADDNFGARLEDAGLTSSQPPQQTIYDGWLLRYSPGKAKRARSVNAIASGVRPLAEKLAHVEAFYTRVGLPCVYRITPYTQPAGLDAALAGAGYGAREESRVMWADLQALSASTAPVQRFSTLNAPEFADLVASLRGYPPAQVAAERERIAQLVLPALCVAAYQDDQPVACGCVVVDSDVAGIFNMVTASAQRGNGRATAIVQHLLQHARVAGARWAYLQVDAANTAARHVYRKFGFRDRYAYWYRARPRQGEPQ